MDLKYFLFQVDMVTPMCTQLTYEGLLNEVMPQIWNCYI